MTDSRHLFLSCRLLHYESSVFLYVSFFVCLSLSLLSRQKKKGRSFTITHRNKKKNIERSAGHRRHMTIASRHKTFRREPLLKSLQFPSVRKLKLPDLYVSSEEQPPSCGEKFAVIFMHNLVRYISAHRQP